MLVGQVFRMLRTMSQNNSSEISWPKARKVAESRDAQKQCAEIKMAIAIGNSCSFDQLIIIIIVQIWAEWQAELTTIRLPYL